jgi:TPR repeat protein
MIMQMLQGFCSAFYEISSNRCDLWRRRKADRSAHGSPASSIKGAVVARQEYGKMARMDVSSREMVEFAAQGGQPDALFELGLSFSTGRDGTVDLVQAHKWFNIAAMRGNDEAKRYRLEIAHDMSKAEIVKAQKLAREWLTSIH